MSAAQFLCLMNTLDSKIELSGKKDFALISEVIAALCVSSHKWLLFLQHGTSLAGASSLIWAQHSGTIIW